MADMIPDIQFSVLCDEVRQEINGHFQFLGVLGNIVGAKGVPVRVGRLFVVNRWTCGQGTFKQKTTVRAPDGTTVVIEGKEVSFTLASTAYSHTCIEGLVNVCFQTAGTYWVEVELNGDLRMRYPITIAVEPPKQSPA